MCVVYVVCVCVVGHAHVKYTLTQGCLLSLRSFSVFIDVRTDARVPVLLAALSVLQRRGNMSP